MGRGCLQAGEPPPTLPVETNGPLRQLYVAYFSDTHVPSAGQLVDAHAIFHSKVWALPPPPQPQRHFLS